MQSTHHHKHNQNQLLNPLVNCNTHASAPKATASQKCKSVTTLGKGHSTTSPIDLIDLTPENLRGGGLWPFNGANNTNPYESKPHLHNTTIGQLRIITIWVSLMVDVDRYHSLLEFFWGLFCKMCHWMMLTAPSVKEKYQLMKVIFFCTSTSLIVLSYIRWAVVLAYWKLLDIGSCSTSIILSCRKFRSHLHRTNDHIYRNEKGQLLRWNGHFRPYDGFLRDMMVTYEEVVDCSHRVQVIDF